MPKYYIANTLISIVGHSQQLADQLLPYIFDTDKTPEITFFISHSQDIDCTCSGEKIWDKTYYYVYRNEDIISEYYGLPLRMRINHTLDFSNIQISILPSDDPYRPSTMLEYMYVGQFFYLFLAKKNRGIMLHSSTIAWQNNGIAFTAPCGTGKSTQAKLWEKFLPNDTIRLNDDKPAILWIDDHFEVFGTPFSGKEKINANSHAPLKALVYLQQAPVDSIERLPINKAVFFLVEQTMRSMIDESITDTNFSYIEKILENVPMYLLKCTPTETAVNTLLNRLIEDKVVDKK